MMLLGNAVFCNEKLRENRDGGEDIYEDVWNDVDGSEINRFKSG
jgi:hypothetical protein